MATGDIPLSGNPVDLRVPTASLIHQLVSSAPTYLRTSLLKPTSLKAVGRTIRAVWRWGFSLAALLESASAAHPGRVCLIDDVSPLTYRELNSRAHAFARALSKRKLGEGSRIAIVARNSRVPVIALVACDLIGAVPMAMNPASSPAQLERTADEYAAQAVVADADYAAAFRKLDVPVFVGYGAEDGLPEALRNTAFSGEATSYAEAISAGLLSAGAPFGRAKRSPTVIMSSGTRGQPKAVVRGVPKSPQVLGSIFGKVPWRTGGVIQLSASLFHAWGWLNLNLVFATASAMILRRRFDGEEAIADLKRYGVTGIVSAAVFLKELLQADSGRGGEGVEFIVSSGNAIPPHLVHELNARFGEVTCNFYGSTEHGPIAVASARELAADPRHAGTVAPGVRTAILDAEGARLPVGEVGRIYSANSESMKGYLGANDPVDVKDHMLATGDLGFFDKDGFLYVAGRADDMVIKGGENVYPRELEELLARQPQIADVYVQGERGEIASKLNCFIVPAPGATIDDAAVNRLVLDNLARHNLPDRIVWLDKLPRNEAGKVVPRLLPVG